LHGFDDRAEEFETQFLDPIVPMHQFCHGYLGRDVPVDKSTFIRASAIQASLIALGLSKVVDVCQFHRHLVVLSQCGIFPKQNLGPSTLGISPSGAMLHHYVATAGQSTRPIMSVSNLHGHKYNTVYNGEIDNYTSLDSRFDDDRPNHDAEVIAATIWEPVEKVELR
jgi:hypothetical protein